MPTGVLTVPGNYLISRSRWARAGWIAELTEIQGPVWVFFLHPEIQFLHNPALTSYEPI